MTITLKRINRANAPFLNAIRLLLVPISQFILAKIVSSNGFDVWGQVAAVLIYVQLASVVSAWGNKDYVLREISQNPSNLITILNNNLFTRLPILAMVLCTILVYVPIKFIAVILVWTLALFIIQSLESMVVFHGKYKRFARAEVVILLITILLSTIFQSSLTTAITVLWFLAAINLVRALFYLIQFRQDIKPRQMVFDLKMLKASFPFFVLVLTGMLFSKIDLYVGEYGLNKIQFGQYQLFLTAFLQIQVLAGLLIMPVSKNIYRFKAKNVLKLCLNFSLFGMAITFPSVFVIEWVLSHFYQISFNPTLYYLAGLFGFLMFISIPIIHFLYGQKKERFVLLANIIGFLLNGITGYLFVFEYGVWALVISTCLSQLIVTLIYFLYLIHKTRFGKPANVS